jgi:putative hydrolase of the HAD superfamily
MANPLKPLQPSVEQDSPPFVPQSGTSAEEAPARAPDSKVSAPFEPKLSQQVRSFAHIDTWVFDLDNTLYPSECNLFAQVDQRMGAFVAKYLGVPEPYARHLQKSYYRQFGTTLSGLMRIHKMEPKAFLDYVHDIDLSVVPPSPELRASIEALPGRKLIFTNGTTGHAERVAARIGILDLFDGICDIVACDYQPKPGADAFNTFVKRHEVTSGRAAMFEDMPQNLEIPHALGMTTVLIRSTYIDHPAQAKARTWLTPPNHIHHIADDLTAFLTTIKPIL